MTPIFFSRISEPFVIQRSTCAAHSAVNSQIKDVRGLVQTGVGAVSCAHHEIVRPCGVGDLQKGERFARLLMYLMCC